MSQQTEAEERWPREVIESPQFVEQRGEVAPDLRRFDEAFAGIEWALARWPEVERVRLTIRLGAGGPHLAVVATVMEKLVLLESLTVLDL
ncbi:MAG: hypothetical protein WEB00_02385 [Dehalococcoidia bacterium]